MILGDVLKAYCQHSEESSFFAGKSRKLGATTRRSRSPTTRPGGGNACIVHSAKFNHARASCCDLSQELLIADREPRRSFSSPYSADARAAANEQRNVLLQAPWHTDVAAEGGPYMDGAQRVNGHGSAAEPGFLIGTHAQAS